MSVADDGNDGATIGLPALDDVDTVHDPQSSGPIAAWVTARTLDDHATLRQFHPTTVGYHAIHAAAPITVTTPRGVKLDAFA